MHSRSVDPDAPLCAHSSQPHYLDFWQCLVPIADVASIAVSGPSTDGSVVTVDVNVRQSAVCLVSVQLASVHTVPHDHCMFVYNILLRCRYNFCRRKLSVMFYSTKCIAMVGLEEMDYFGLQFFDKHEQMVSN